MQSLSRVETYYHDGVRRIQEVFTDPVHAETPWADPHGTPPPAQTTQTRMEREYIWAAHETAGVNELHVAIDWFDREAWLIQDAHNQTVMGYADAAGDLVEQRVYTPFGQVLSADKTALANPGGLYNDFRLRLRLRLGHHGLFADRLDADTTQPVLRHSDARTVYLTNNRVYEPTRGSWLQRDPNATGMLTQRMTYHSGLLSASDPPAPLAISTHFGDGVNLFSAYRSSPLYYSDPTGLFSALELGSAMSVQGLVGGLLGGSISAATGGSFTDGALAGATFGALFGGVGYGVQSAFSLTAGGLSGGVGGGATGAVSQQGFRSYSAFKRAMGPVGPGMNWHHIVEQRAVNVVRFGAERIHNAVNVVRVPEQIHIRFSSYYSSKQAFTGSQTVRK